MSIAPMLWKQYRLEWGQRTHVMGIINVTPDSFAGDGLIKISQDPTTEDAVVQRAVEQARQYVEDGATLIDVGGESTRPGAATTPAEEEMARVLPVITALRKALPTHAIISIDTYKAEVAHRALECGADVVNDIWGFQHDPEMAAVVAQHGVPAVLMANMRGFQRRELLSDVTRFLARSIDIALAAGVAWDHLILDPGLGFGTGPEGHLLLLRRLGELRIFGRPLLIGTSRKSAIGKVLGGLPPEERVEGTAATVALGIAQGADIVRVHDVHAMMRVVKMSDAVVRGYSEPPPEITAVPERPPQGGSLHHRESNV